MELLLAYQHAAGGANKSVSFWHQWQIEIAPLALLTVLMAVLAWWQC